jgi:hypothetical protein
LSGIAYHTTKVPKTYTRCQAMWQVPVVTSLHLGRRNTWAQELESRMWNTARPHLKNKNVFSHIVETDADQEKSPHGHNCFIPQSQDGYKGCFPLCK